MRKWKSFLNFELCKPVVGDLNKIGNLSNGIIGANQISNAMFHCVILLRDFVGANIYTSCIVLDFREGFNASLWWICQFFDICGSWQFWGCQMMEGVLQISVIGPLFFLNKTLWLAAPSGIIPIYYIAFYHLKFKDRMQLSTYICQHI